MLYPVQVKQKYKLGQVVFYEDSSVVHLSIVRNARYDFRESLIYYTIVTDQDKVLEIEESNIFKISKYVKSRNKVNILYKGNLIQGRFRKYNKYTDTCLIQKDIENPEDIIGVPFKDLISVVSKGKECYIQHE